MQNVAVNGMLNIWYLVIGLIQYIRIIRIGVVVLLGVHMFVVLGVIRCYHLYKFIFM